MNAKEVKIKFLDELPPPRARKVSETKWTKILDQIKKKPNTWASVGIHTPASFTRLKLTHRDFEYISKNTNIKNQLEWYIRYIGDPELDNG